jgi:tetratricopeptide (TPR) repeat protein
LRVSLRNSATLVLLAAGTWPLLLLAVYAASPLRAVHMQQFAATWSIRAFWTALGAGLVLALCYPPLPALLRLWAAGLLARLRADRGPLLRAQGELRGFETADRHLEAARAALAVFDPQAALPHLARALELDPALVAARHLLGSALLRLGRPAEARALLVDVVARDPAHAFGDALLLLGRACMLTGDPRAAAELLARHGQQHGGNRRSHFWLAQSLRAIGAGPAARAAFAVAAAPPPGRTRLTAEENWFRARARAALWGRRESGSGAAEAAPR